jgi:hypothetical protein
MIPNLREILDLLSDEEKCISFLFEKGIIYQQSFCDSCGSNQSLKGKQWHCLKKTCRKKTSIFKESFFAKSHLKCSEILLIGYLWLAKVGQKSIQKITGHSPRVITKYLEYFRQLVSNVLYLFTFNFAIWAFNFAIWAFNFVIWAFNFVIIFISFYKVRKNISFAL